MSNKLILSAALGIAATIAVALPLIGRGRNPSSLPENFTTAKSTTKEEARIATEDEPRVLSFEVTPAGFEPSETIAPRGRFLILLQNRTGRRDLEFWLARENRERLARSEPQKRDWKAQVQLSPGTYIIGETNHPEWKAIIRITN